MQENKKFDWKAVAIVIMAGLLIFCLVKINNANDRIESLNYELSGRKNEINSLWNELNSIYANVDTQLKKEASLFSDVDYSYGAMNEDNKAAELRLSIIPKVISDEIKLSVTIGNTTAELVKNGNSFEGTVDVGLFEPYMQYPLVTVQTASDTKTEFLENVDVENLFRNFLPTLYATAEGSRSYANGKLTVDFNLHLDRKQVNSKASFHSIFIVEEIDGLEVDREDITDEINNAGDRKTMFYHKSINISQGQTLTMYVVAEDSLGYIHKTPVWGWYQREGNDGADAQAVLTMEYIYDKNGNLLYPADKSLYQ